MIRINKEKYITGRNILTENEARKWFDQFGKDIGITFEDMFGKMIFNENPARSTYKIKVVYNILFIKIHDVIEDEFNCSPEIIVKDNKLIFHNITPN